MSDPNTSDAQLSLGGLAASTPVREPAHEPPHAEVHKPPPLPKKPERPTQAIEAVLRGESRVVVCDAFELLSQLPDSSVDLVITDPPYQSLELHRARGTTTRLTTDWFSTVPDDKLPELFRQVARVLKDDRHFYLFCDEVTADVIKHQQGIGAARLPNGARKCESGLVYWKELIWAKTTLDGQKIRGGTGYHYRAACERVLFFEKGKRALQDLGIPDVLMAPRAQVKGPAVKPGAIMRTLILQSSSAGELVIDPFCGTGVVGVQARAEGRRFLLGDLDLAYLDPTLADVAPVRPARSGPAIPEDDVEPLAPPPLEELAGAAPELRGAAEAAGWLEDGRPTDALQQLLSLRPIEREPAVRRGLRNLPPAAFMAAATEGGPVSLELLRGWRAWALRERGQKKKSSPDPDDST